MIIIMSLAKWQVTKALAAPIQGGKVFHTLAAATR